MANAFPVGSPDTLYEDQETGFTGMWPRAIRLFNNPTREVVVVYYPRPTIYDDSLGYTYNEARFASFDEDGVLINNTASRYDLTSHTTAFPSNYFPWDLRRPVETSDGGLIHTTIHSRNELFPTPISYFRYVEAHRLDPDMTLRWSVLVFTDTVAGGTPPLVDTRHVASRTLTNGNHVIAVGAQGDTTAAAFNNIQMKILDDTDGSVIADIVVETTDFSNPSDYFSPVEPMLCPSPDGTFVLFYARNYFPSFERTRVAQRYSADGTPIGSLMEFGASSTVSYSERPAWPMVYEDGIGFRMYVRSGSTYRTITIPDDLDGSVTEVTTNPNALDSFWLDTTDTADGYWRANTADNTIVGPWLRLQHYESDATTRIKWPSLIAYDLHAANERNQSATGANTSTGKVVVAYSMTDGYDPDDPDYNYDADLYYQVFQKSGAPVGDLGLDPYAVAPLFVTTGNVSLYGIQSRKDGAAVVSYMIESDYHLQLLDNVGEPAGSPIIVSDSENVWTGIYSAYNFCGLENCGVVWASGANEGTFDIDFNFIPGARDGSGYFSRYSGDGTLVQDEVQFHAVTDAFTVDEDGVEGVGMVSLANGGFVIYWSNRGRTRFNFNAPVDDVWDNPIYSARWYDASGTPLGPRVIIEDRNLDSEGRSLVAPTLYDRNFTGMHALRLPNGNVMFAWDVIDYNTNNPRWSRSFLRVYDASGTPVSGVVALLDGLLGTTRVAERITGLYLRDDNTVDVRMLEVYQWEDEESEDARRISRIVAFDGTLGSVSNGAELDAGGISLYLSQQRLVMPDGSLLYVHSEFTDTNFRLVRNNDLPYLEGGVDTIIDSDLDYVVSAKMTFLTNGNVALAFEGTDEDDVSKLGVLYFALDGNAIPTQSACGVVVLSGGQARRVIWLSRRPIP